jgi:hypothetical protein
MKWLFFILLLANLGMFLLIYPQKADKSVNNGLPDVGNLYLYEELTVLNAADSDAIEANRDPGNGKAGREAESASNLTNNLIGYRPPQEQLVTKPDTTDVLVAATGEEDRAGGDAENPITGDEVAEKQAPVSVPICRTVGYLETRSDAEIVSVNLRAMGLKPELRSESRNEEAGIWVLIPPQSSRRKAMNIANSLEKDGITDLWRFTSGDLVHAISLGLFRNMARAEIRKKEIERLGYEVTIQPRYRQKTKYWLYYQQNTPLLAGEKKWGELLEKFPDLKINKVTCR